MHRVQHISGDCACIAWYMQDKVHKRIMCLNVVTYIFVPSVKTSFTLRESSENRSYLATFRTWLHHVWCTLVSIVLSVLKLVGGWKRLEVLGLAVRLTSE